MVVSPRFLGKMGERGWCTEWGPSVLSLSQVSFAEWHPPLGFFGLFWWLSFCKMFCKLEAWEGEWGTWNCMIRAAYFVRDCFCDSDIWWLPFCSWHVFFTDKASHSVPMFVSIFGGGPHFAADLCARWLPTTSNANFNGYLLYKASKILKNSSGTFLSNSAVKLTLPPDFPVFSRWIATRSSDKSHPGSVKRIGLCNGWHGPTNNASNIDAKSSRCGYVTLCRPEGRGK